MEEFTGRNQSSVYMNTVKTHKLSEENLDAVTMSVDKSALTVLWKEWPCYWTYMYMQGPSILYRVIWIMCQRKLFPYLYYCSQVIQECLQSIS